jgi:homocysteine S-methyltransferase
VEDPSAAGALGGLYAEYVRAAQDVRLPVVLGTPTFRASAGPLQRSGRSGPDAVRTVNAAAFRLLEDVRRRSGHRPVWIAGVIGPAGDAYTPEVALSPEQGRDYHLPQAGALAEAGVDFLFAPTFPAVSEAIGVCRAMGETGLPFVVSFVLGADGRVLDGAPLRDAVDRVDQVAAPMYHSISCVHPSVAAKALASVAGSAGAGRVAEVKANASALSPAELVKLDHLAGDDPRAFAEQMVRLRTDYGIRILGGCCGTRPAHMRAVAALLAAD